MSPIHSISTRTFHSIHPLVLHCTTLYLLSHYVSVTWQADVRYWQRPATLCQPVSWTGGSDMSYLCYTSWANTDRTASVFPTNVCLHSASPSREAGRGDKLCRERLWVRRWWWLVRGRWRVEWYCKGTCREKRGIVSLCSKRQLGCWAWSVAALHSLVAW